MLLRDRGYRRPVQLGPHPLECLARDEALRPEPCDLPPPAATDNPLALAAREYVGFYAPFARGEPAPEQAPVSADLQVRTDEIKGAAYYFDAAQVGVCRHPTDNGFAVVLLVAWGREIEADNVASTWITGAECEIARMRAAEIACAIAGHIRALGFDATAHWAGASEENLAELAVLAGVAQQRSHNTARITNPYLGSRFEVAAITTQYELLADTPLARHAAPGRLRYWLGIHGATSGRARNQRAKRASHLGAYPMERVKRVERPTTLILDDEVPRVPKRAEFFMRARSGDLGAKAQREVARFAFKHPITHGLMPVLRSMVPHQDGDAAQTADPRLLDSAENTKAIKSLAYHMGADLVGICEIPRYAWYSHDQNGTEIEPYHRYAVVMLIDQGYDTMEGASGDDWISGCQSMRGYVRGAQIAGVMASFLRRLGYSARPQTNADSHVLQIPLVLLAGLGELSRIGELVLNPFLGPRSKSVVLTTDLPLLADQPIDFGLQYFCSRCNKCARECPVNAIPFGDKVMFNGYEIWKPDVERCTRYRVTNPKGSACGRCMKTCPLNKVVNADGSLLHRVGTWLGLHARWLKPLIVPIAVRLDDALGFGRRNPVKRWWQDLEIVDGKTVKPSATNERDIDPSADVSGSKSPVGYYHAADMPAANAPGPVAVNHRAAIQRAGLLETVSQAQARRQRNEPPPAHYVPVKNL